MAYLVEIAGFTVIEQFSISEKVTSLRVEQQATTPINADRVSWHHMA